MGNKSDLPGKMRRVSYEQASYFAHQQRCSFVEASARRNQHVKEAFEMLVKQATDRQLTATTTSKIDPSLSYQQEKKGRKSKDCVIQ